MQYNKHSSSGFGFDDQQTGFPLKMVQRNDALFLFGDFKNLTNYRRTDLTSSSASS